ncbi:MAG: low molecular weight protein arginine phosphatase [Candidatus Omnitrophota bacterium]
MFKSKTILVVCTGNSCRSVMAGSLLQEVLKDKGEYYVLTAGTAAIEGLPATPEAVEVMAEENIDISSHRSRTLTESLVRQADIILVMENKHKDYILAHYPQASGKVYLLSEFGRIESEDKLVDPNIPDPIGKSADFYRYVFDIIKESIARTVQQLEGK